MEFRVIRAVAVEEVAFILALAGMEVELEIEIEVEVVAREVEETVDI